ncbi:hypothetical protein M5X00_13870 [Paenibacillus alvei]|uniref:hypothetical protein n=1 Tax=Paenibacillus alvei TaxID=44250 RepID=UPI00227FAF52|nr:hypothetical protein [Paenibacillus alvei]MCY9755330.1 hypothetical protein [Paenibacillus alvei]
MSREAEYRRMKAALRNIVDVSHDAFAHSQARYGLGLNKSEIVKNYESHSEYPACYGEGKPGHEGRD